VLLELLDQLSDSAAMMFAGFPRGFQVFPAALLEVVGA
jgi:hypothetical protein